MAVALMAVGLLVVAVCHFSGGDDGVNGQKCDARRAVRCSSRASRAFDWLASWSRNSTVERAIHRDRFQAVLVWCFDVTVGQCMNFKAGTVGHARNVCAIHVTSRQ